MPAPTVVPATSATAPPMETGSRVKPSSASTLQNKQSSSMESRWSAAAEPSEREGSAREDDDADSATSEEVARGRAGQPREKGVGRVDETRADRLAGTARAAVGALAQGEDGHRRRDSRDDDGPRRERHRGARHPRARLVLCAPSRRREIKRDSRSAKRRQGAKWQQTSPGGDPDIVRCAAAFSHRCETAMTRRAPVRASAGARPWRHRHTDERARRRSREHPRQGDRSRRRA